MQGKGGWAEVGHPQPEPWGPAGSLGTRGGGGEGLGGALFQVIATHLVWDPKGCVSGGSKLARPQAHLS